MLTCHGVGKILINIEYDVQGPLTIHNYISDIKQLYVRAQAQLLHF